MHGFKVQLKRSADPAIKEQSEGRLPECTLSAAGDEAGAKPETDNSHYEEVASVYEQAFFYSSIDYRDWLLEHLLEHMQLPDEEASIVDLGAGTGNFSQALAMAARCRQKLLAVDPFKEMLDKAAAADAGCAGFAQQQGPPSCTHVLLKEVLHHIPLDDLPALQGGLVRRLEPGGCAVTITRPQEVDYPLFQRAREIWKEHQPHHSTFVEAMQQAGFKAEVHIHDYHAELPKVTWLGMVRSRFWSTFSHCTPEELEQGIAELEQQYAGQDILHFTDRLLFLVARKPPSEAEGGTAAAEPAELLSS